ncbi:hypothetical protein [Actinospica sp.]|jgi:hypothetical protein|uniref:hypothetical protein n=1 Tax=Actinospica sp. TaxID=1872142 RepID=UPI002CF1E154|nr:hypothetical protein [Actinospica sp.]HWG24474.1 hypothetical protein [Actinospica sp.]
MSYQPTGPYPAHPQQAGYGAPAKPPMPPAVQRAFTLMLVGAGLEVVNVVLSFLFNHQVDARIQQALNAGTIDTSTSVNIASAAFGGIVGIGLWVWMAFANRAGKNWARITGTVFFGISSLGLLGDIAIIAAAYKWIGGVIFVLVAENALSWVLGLTVVVLLWKKESGPYFKPQTFYPAPYGYPGGPMPYTYPIMPGQPMRPQDGYPQQPADPWATPPGN